MLYSYSFSKMNYTCTYNLSFRPHFLIKKELKDLSVLTHPSLQDFDSGVIEFYMESNTIENIVDALVLYGFDTYVSDHIQMLESFFLSTSQEYHRLYSFHTQSNEFSMYFRVFDIEILMEIIREKFQKYSAIMLDNFHEFSMYGDTKAPFYFFKTKYIDGKIVPSIFFEFPKNPNDSLQSFLDFLSSKSSIKITNHLESNLERMFTFASKTIGYTLNLETLAIDNIYFE